MARNGKRRLLAEMNVVPYIDVMLVLVVILMVAAPYVNPSIVDEWAVADLWVLQYDMSGGAAGSLAARRYVASTVQDLSLIHI